jgi:hypothetical protein
VISKKESRNRHRFRPGEFFVLAYREEDLCKPALTTDIRFLSLAGLAATYSPKSP